MKSMERHSSHHLTASNFFFPSLYYINLKLLIERLGEGLWLFGTVAARMPRNDRERPFADFEGAVDSLEKQLKEVADLVQRAEQVVRSRRREIASLDEDMKKINERIHDAEKALKRLESERKEIMKDKEAFVAAKKDKSVSDSEIHSRKTKLNKRIEGYNTRHTKLQADMKEAESELHAKEEELLKKNKELATAEEELIEKIRRRDSLQLSCLSLFKELAERKQKCEELQSRLVECAISTQSPDSPSSEDDTPDDESSLSSDESSSSSLSEV